MARGPVVVVTITADERDAVRGARAASNAMEDFGTNTSRTGDIIKGILGAAVLRKMGDELVQFGRSAVNGASNLAEQESKVSVVFGDQAKVIQDWSRDSSTALGQSRQQALAAVGTYGNLFQAFGLGRDESAKMSTSLVELAADLASFNNTSVDDALKALQSGLSGEQEPLRQFGISLSDARLKTEALSLGLITSTKEALDPATKSQAAYSLIMKDSTLAQGDFARTSDGLANQQRIVTAQFADLTAQLGAQLIPVMLMLTSFITNSLIPTVQQVTHFFRDHQEALAALAIVVSAVLIPALVLLAIAAWGAVAPIVGIAAGFAAPILIIAALAAGVIYAYQHFETFRNVVDSVVGFLRDQAWPVIKDIGEIIGWVVQVHLSAFESAWWAVHGVIDGVSDAVGWLIEQMRRVIGLVPSLPSGDSIRRIGLGIATGGASEIFRRFAEGGIVTGPTLALIGEAGAEAVIPLDRAFGGIPGSGGSNIYLTVNAGLGTDGRSVGEQIRQVLVQERLRGGPLGLG